ncbi:UbiA family prenyltransferase [Nocardioides okcheonensis]|uniref:UbiA family prenyltransferase n=1 Tax=Nocardioides okcheonensis TaxID=2894081 RepID=UPI001E29B087|nr:UbiA family prenyltransferase [Nocardioides okcheonensis]UFN43692.1 UbiA family prenyltransferase [Nocardioides okcheonensis]
MATVPALLLVRAAHPRQAVATAAAVGAAAAVAGRPPREVALVAATVLVGQAVLGWLDDLADRERDARRRPDRPLASGRLDPGTVWFSVACGVLLVVPLAVANGRTAATAYLASLVVAALGDRLLHARPLSFVPWTVSFALLPAFLAHGGWGGVGTSTPPTVAMTALAAALGLTVHVLLALPGLVDDHEEGERSFPLLLALRTGTPRLLVLASVATGVLAVAVLFTGQTVGLA